MQPSCNLHDLRTIITCCGFLPYGYLKSLRSHLDPNDYLKSCLQYHHDQRAVSVPGSSDLPAMCLRATGLPFFKLRHNAELNKIVEATMPVNPYDDCRVSLRCFHVKGDLDIVNSSEGNQSILYIPGLNVG